MWYPVLATGWRPRSHSHVCEYLVARGRLRKCMWLPPTRTHEASFISQARLSALGYVAVNEHKNSWPHPSWIAVGRGKNIKHVNKWHRDKYTITQCGRGSDCERQSLLHPPPGPAQLFESHHSQGSPHPTPRTPHTPHFPFWGPAPAFSRFRAGCFWWGMGLAQGA